MATLTDRTVLPEHGSQYEAVEAILDGTGAVVLEGEVGRIELPESVRTSLREIVDALRNDEAVAIAPIRTSLTTQEAAERLGISRPSLIKLLEEGKIEYTRPGRHRRIELRALLAYQESLKNVRRESLEAMAAADAELPEEAMHVGFPRTR